MKIESFLFKATIDYDYDVIGGSPNATSHLPPLHTCPSFLVNGALNCE